jgi:uncharacterized membrane protein
VGVRVCVVSGDRERECVESVGTESVGTGKEMESVEALGTETSWGQRKRRGFGIAPYLV